MLSTSSGVVSLDSWGIATPETLEVCKERMKEWKPALMELAHQVHEAMLKYEPCPQTKLRAKWFLADGTLLGAYRSGKMIPHDYDFDYGLCFLTEDGCVADLEQCRKEVFKVSKHLTEHLDKKYTVMGRDDFACKVELHQESSGVYWDYRGDWYNVRMDVQVWFSSDQKKLDVAYFLDNYHQTVDVKVSSVFPLSEIDFESSTWPCPGNTKEFLTEIYGYIGSPAKYDPSTRKYVPLTM